MITFAILLLITVLIVLLSFQSRTNRKLERLEHEIITLKKILSQKAIEPVTVLENKTSIRKEKDVEKPFEEPKPDVHQPTNAEEKYWRTGFQVVPQKEPDFSKQEGLQREEKSVQQAAFTEEKTAQQRVENTPTQSTTQPKLHKPSFFERNPDLEKFIGENLVSKIGIAILVLAIGYFVKFAIDNEWIGTIGRVAVGIVCGGILVAIAHRLRTNFHAFSSVLAGGGLAVFYFTITLAFQQYHLFSQTVAFVIMLVITAFAVLLALLYNRQELAVIALTGGFAAPLLISTGSGNYVTLFIYLIILNTGLLLLAYNKAWRILNTTAFVFTVVLFASWLYTLKSNEPKATYINAFLFATIFYLLFLVINIANNIKEKKQFLAFDFSILLANTSLFFSVGLYCLHNINAENYNGIFSAIMGIFNLGLTYFLFRKRNIDNNILYLLVGITLTFVSLTAPLQLHGHFITLFWASEAVLLGWLYLKSRIAIIQYASLIIYVCMLFSLLGDWANVYGIFSFTVNHYTTLPIIFNRGLITSFYAAIASYLLTFLLSKNNSKLLFVNASYFLLAALIILFLAVNIEINYQFHYYYPLAGVAALYQELFTFAFVLLLVFIDKKTNHLKIPVTLKLSLLIVCEVLYFMLLPTTINLLHTLLADEYKIDQVIFIAHWVVALLAILIFYSLLTPIFVSEQSQKEKLTWIMSITVVMFLSAEAYLATLQLFYSTAQAEEAINRVFIKAVLPVLWGLCSFGFMWLGMKYKYKTLRVISLSLFLITLLKLFLYDISNIPVAGKIIAFFCLGVLLLIISFMYQRLKKIIIEDEAKPHA